MATHSSILAWRIPWTEEPSWATVHGVAKELDTTERLNNNSSALVSFATSLHRVNDICLIRF